MSGQRLAHFFRNSVQSRNWMTAARWMDGVVGSLPLWALWMDKPTFACGFAFGLDSRGLVEVREPQEPRKVVEMVLREARPSNASS